MEKQAIVATQNLSASFGADVEARPARTANVQERHRHDPRHGTRNANSRRLTQDRRRTESPGNNGQVQVGTDGIDIMPVQDFEDKTRRQSPAGLSRRVRSTRRHHGQQGPTRVRGWPASLTRALEDIQV